MKYDSEIVREKSGQWISRVLKESISDATLPPSKKNASAISCSLLALQALRKLEQTLDLQAIDPAECLKSCQDPSSGYFIDIDDKNGDDYLKQRATFLALLGLRELRTKAPHPLRFMDDWSRDDALRRLDDLWNSKLSRKGERVSHVLLFLVYRMETDRDQNAAIVFHQILDWLLAAQTAKTGLWAVDQDSDLDGSCSVAGCVLPFFEYARRPIQRRSRMVEAMIQLFESGRIPPTAHSELSLVSALAAATYQLSYRQEEIEAIFAQIHQSICRSQGEDGSFADPESGAKPDEEGLATAALEGTFLRLSTLAIIEQRARGESGHAQWRSPDWPGPGYHHPLYSLTEHERETLPVWLRPTATTVPGTQTEPHPEEPRITVVIPCFNLGRYLHEAVESVLLQTYQELEIVIVDDGSTDPFTTWLLQNFDRPKTTIVRQANAGLASSRNRAIAQASGRYICCLDPDDRLRPEFFAKAVEILEREPDVGLVSGFFQMFDERDDVFRYGSCELPDLLAYNQAIEPAIFRRELWEKTGGYCETFTTSGIEDWDLWISFIELGYRAHVISEIVWEYRIRPDQMSTEMYQPERWGRAFSELVERHCQSYEKHWPAVLATQASRWAELRAWANECRRAAAWWEAKSAVWQFRAQTHDRLSRDQQRWIDTLLQDKTWLDQQRKNWQQLAEGRERLLAEQQRWIDALTQDKKWLEEQREKWQQLAEDREKLLQEQRGWISEIEAAKNWLEAERVKWQTIAEERLASGENEKRKSR